jgi:hypothetical protein
VSHHLDSPASRRDPRLNVTDIYAFDGDGATVLTMIVNTSLAGAGRVAGFHPEGRYEFNVHLDGARSTRQLRAARRPAVDRTHPRRTTRRRRAQYLSRG